MLAPIALYPDALLSQILMAATYPLEVVQAARWSNSHPELRGELAVKGVDERDWDPSVKSLVAFPQILSMMDEKLDWTQRLGDAFLSQQEQVMRTVQYLRSKAYSAGNLRSSEQLVVEQQGTDIIIEPPVPEVIYVPYYDPIVVYGPWWAPAYPPVYWRPWPGYYVHPGYGFGWGTGIAVGGDFFFGACDWRHHRIWVGDRRPFYYHALGRWPTDRQGGAWRHDPDHRRGVPYRNPLAREQFARSGASPDARRELRGNQRPMQVPRLERPASPGTQAGFFAPRVDERANPVTRSVAAPQYRVVTPTAPPQKPVAHPAYPPPAPAYEGLPRGQDSRHLIARGQQQIHHPGAAVPAFAPQAHQVAPTMAPANHQPAPAPAPAARASSGGEQRSAIARPER